MHTFNLAGHWQVAKIKSFVHVKTKTNVSNLSLNIQLCSVCLPYKYTYQFAYGQAMYLGLNQENINLKFHKIMHQSDIIIQWRKKHHKSKRINYNTPITFYDWRKLREKLVRNGVGYLCIDEVHKYYNHSNE